MKILVKKTINSETAEKEVLQDTTSYHEEVSSEESVNDIVSVEEKAESVEISTGRL